MAMLELPRLQLAIDIAIYTIMTPDGCKSSRVRPPGLSLNVNIPVLTPCAADTRTAAKNTATRSPPARPLRTRLQMQTCKVSTAEWEIAMREKGSIMAFCAATAAIGATAFLSADARAVPLAGDSGLNAAIHSATPAQEVRYVCRGSHRHKCYYVSVARPSERPPGYYPYNKGVWGNMYPGEDEYNVHYWGSGANSGGR